MYSWGNSTRWNNKNSSYFVAKPLLLETPRKSWRIWFPILVTGFQIVSSSGLPVSHLCVHNAPDVLSGSQVWDVPMCPRTISHFDSDHRIIFHFPSVCLKRAQVWRRAFCSSLNNILFVFVNALMNCIHSNFYSSAVLSEDPKSMAVKHWSLIAYVQRFVWILWIF